MLDSSNRCLDRQLCWVNTKLHWRQKPNALIQLELLTKDRLGPRKRPCGREEFWLRAVSTRHSLTADRGRKGPPMFTENLCWFQEKSGSSDYANSVKAPALKPAPISRGRLEICCSCRSLVSEATNQQPTVISPPVPHRGTARRAQPTIFAPAHLDCAGSRSAGRSSPSACRDIFHRLRRTPNRRA
jgi:hypothetical protein